jgi:anthranilate synthase component 1
MSSERAIFDAQAAHGGLVILSRRLMSDQLTPVLAYRRLVAADARTAPSFLFESVETTGSVGRYSILGAQPKLQIIAKGTDVEVRDHRSGSTTRRDGEDPLKVLRALAGQDRMPPREALAALKLPSCFIGGWVGYASYDTVRYLEPQKLPFPSAPRDDRGLADFQFGLYRQVVVIDQVTKTLHAIVSTSVRDHPTVNAAWHALQADLEDLVARIETHSVPLSGGAIDLDPAHRPETPRSATSREDFERSVMKAKEYIAAGDAFQIVLSQRLERTTERDPFEIYRALRVVNPSPYQIYLQAEGCILVASSPEILCRVRDRVVTNRPLAGTRPRGTDEASDLAIGASFMADEKERAEHVMLVDLGRNDLGRVSATSAPCTIDRAHDHRALLARHAHRLECRGRRRTGQGRARRAPRHVPCRHPQRRAQGPRDADHRGHRAREARHLRRRRRLRSAIDGDLDVALALRTMVIPTTTDRAPWTVHLQAGAGVVLDSDPRAEYEETLNKAAALGRAIDLAEGAFARIKDQG